MSTLGLAIITKNETSKLERALASVKDYVDEIVVVSTAAHKPTEAAARRAGARVERFKWVNDFAAARNYSFSLIQSDWTLWIDSDDIVKHPEFISEVVRSAETEGAVGVYLRYDYAQDEYGNPIADHWKPRLLRTGYYQWEKPVHENAVLTKAGFETRDDRVFIRHNLTNDESFAHNIRNYEILLAEYERDQDKTDPRTLHYLGNTCGGLGNAYIAKGDTGHGRELLESALYFYQAHAKLSGWPEETYFSLTSAASCARSLGKLDEAYNFDLEATKIGADWPTAYFGLAETATLKEDWRAVIHWSKVGFQLPIPKFEAHIIDQTTYTVKPLVRLGVAYLATLQPKKAIGALEAATRYQPGNPEIEAWLTDAKEALGGETFISNLQFVTEWIAQIAPDKVSDFLNALPNQALHDIRVTSLRNTYLTPTHWPERSIVFFCGQGPEDWADPSVKRGIGGSEEATVYLAREFARLGYDVTVFNNCGEMAGDYHGVHYRHYLEFSARDKFDTLILWRNAALLNVVDLKAKNLWLWAHDRLDDTHFSPTIVEKLDKVVVLSKYHRQGFPSVPEDKILYSRNGLDVTQLEAAIATETRDPKRVIYMSSYDRGLEHLLAIWPEVRQATGAELHVYYGLNSYRAMGGDPAWADMIKAKLQQDGVTDHGRVGQPELARAVAQSGVWAYPCHFWEISCIGAMRAQAGGAIPVATDYAALNETIQHGVKVTGVTDMGVMPPVTLEQFKNELIALLNDPERQDSIRKTMVPDCQTTLTWTGVAKQWAKELK